jgi:hypothetical protein
MGRGEPLIVGCQFPVTVTGSWQLTNQYVELNKPVTGDRQPATGN